MIRGYNIMRIKKLDKGWVKWKILRGDRYT